MLFCVLTFIAFVIPYMVRCETYKRVCINQLSITYQLEDGKWGFFDISTGYNSGAIFDNIWDNCFEQDTPIFVNQNELWGYADRTTGEITIPYQFTSDHGLPCFRHGYALVSNYIVKNEDACIYDTYLINKKGERVLLPSGYDIITGVCGTKNTIVIGGYDSSGQYKYGLYRIGKGIIFPPLFDDIFAGDCNFYCYFNDEDKIGIIDADGNIITDPIYENYNFPISYSDQLSHNGITGYYTLHQDDGSNILIFFNDTENVLTIFK